MMYDGAAVATAAQHFTPHHHHHDGASPGDIANTPSAPAAGDSDVARQNHADTAKDATHTDQQGMRPGDTVVFIDTQINNYQAIVAAIDPGTKIILFDGTQEGLHEIAQDLKGVHGLASIDIIAHGAVDAMRIGTDLVTNDNISDYAADLSAIGKAVAHNGQIDLYGCDVAAGGDGFLDALKAATGRDIAASVDATGASARGGNWTLEASTGPSPSALPADLNALQAFDATLVTPTATIHGVTSTDQISLGTPGGWADNMVIATDTAGDIFVTGSFEGSVNFGGTTLTTPASNLRYLTFVAKYNSSGALQWVKDFTGNTANPAATYWDYGTAIAVSPDGSKVYVGGAFFGTINFDGTHSVTAGDGSFTQGSYIAQLNGSGTYQWAITAYSNPSGNQGAGSSSITGLAVDSGGNVIAAERYDGSLTYPYNYATVTIHPVTGSAIALGDAPLGRETGLILKATSAGAITWTAKVAATGSGGDQYMYALALDSSDNIYVSGQFYDTNFISSNGATTEKITTRYNVVSGGQTYSVGDYGAFLAKLNSSGIFQWEYTISTTSTGWATPTIYGIAIDQYGPVIVGNYVDLTVINGTTYHTHVTTNSSGYQYVSTRVFVEQIDTSGNFKWIKAEADNGHASWDQGWNVAVDAAGNVVLAGTISSDSTAAVNFDGKTLNPPGAAYQTEAFLWVLTPGSSSATTVFLGGLPSSSSASTAGLLPLSGGGVLLGLNITGTADADPGAGTTTIGTSSIQSGALIKYGSADLGEVAANSAPVLSLSSTVGFTEQGSAVVLASGLTVTDDGTTLAGATITVGGVQSGDTLNFSAQNGITGSYSGGVLTLSGSSSLANYQTALRSITFSSNSDNPTNYGANTSRTISWVVNDGQSTNNLSTAVTSTVNVTAVNDAPTVILPSSYSASEQVNLLLHGTGISISDVDGTSGVLTLSVIEGTLTVSAGSTGATISGSGGNSVTISGTNAKINQVLSGTGGATITYLDSSNTPSSSTTLTMQFSDSGNTGTGGTQTVTDTATINITAVNDAPVATITPTSYSTPEQTSLDLKTNGFAVSDVDDGGASETATLSVTEGTLTVTAGTSGANVSNSGTASVTITGTLAQINALFNSDSTSTVSYIDNSDNPSATATLTLSINDGGHTGSGGAQSGSDTATINITAVNDAPVATASGGSYGATENAALNIKNTGLSVSDADAGSSSVTVTLSVGEGTLVVTKGGTGATVTNSGTSTVTIAGTLTDINALLNTDGSSTVSYTDNNNDPSASTTLTLSINDGGHSGSGGALSATATKIINVTAINDPPTLTATALNPTYTENGAAIPLFYNTAISTVESGQTVDTIVLTVSNVTDGAAEILKIDGSDVALTNGNSVSTSGQSMTAAVDLSGTTATVTVSKSGGISRTVAQTLIDDLTYRDTSEAPTVAGRTVTLTSIRDNGLTTGGGSDTATLSVASTVTVAAVNDAPVATMGSDYSVSEQTALDLKNTGLSVSDIDAGSNSVTVTLSVGEGTLTVTQGGTSATVLGSGTSTVTITGTLTDINALLNTDGSSTVGYIDNTDTPSASTQLTLTVNDGGHSGNGGALTASTSKTITIGNDNDPPTLSASAVSPTFTEGGSAVTLFSGAAVSTVESGQAIDQIVLTVSNVGEGSSEFLKIDGSDVALTDTNSVSTSHGLTAAVAVSGGTATVTISKSGGIAETSAQSLLNGMTYRDTSDAPTAGNRVVTVTSMRDTGGTSATLSVASTVTVAAVNDAPVATNSAAGYSATEDVALNLKATGMSVSDVDAGSSAVTVTLSVGEGTLTVTQGGTSATVLGSGTSTVTITGTLADINALLNTDSGSTVSYTETNNIPSASTDLTLTMNDGGHTGSGAR